MSNFVTDGFLGDGASFYESQITHQYSDQLDVAKEVNRIAHEIIWSVEIDRNNLSSSLMGTLLTRQVEAFQSFLILIGKGLLFQAQIILRNIAESMFIVGAIAKDRNVTKDIMEQADRSRLGLAKGQEKFRIRNGYQVPDRLKNLIKELEDKIRERKEEGGKQRFTTKRIAEIAQMEDYYDAIYGLASLPVHTSALSLNQVLSVGRDGEVEGLNYPPEVHDLAVWILTAIEMTLNTLCNITEHFSLDSSRKRIEEMGLRIKALTKKEDVSSSFR